MDVKGVISDVTEKIQKSAHVKAVFGEPVERKGITVIPVSRVSVSGGGGGALEGSEEEKGKKGQGMGLGVRAKSTPVGYIEITDSSARFVEITEQKHIIFGGMALGAFAVFTITRLIKKFLK
jgi:uncharacterized spore protein YtfJ